MKMDADKALALYKNLSGEIEQWMTTYEELAWFIAPNRVGFVSKKSEGEIKTEYLYDSIGMEVQDDLSNFLASGLTPSAYQWATARFRDDDLNKDKDAKTWLEDSIRRVFVALGESNFYGAIHECYTDISGFGTTSLGCREKKDIWGNFSGVHFDWIHMREIVGIRDEYGEMTTTCRLYEDTAAAWYEKFGDEAGEGLTSIMASQPNRKFKFLHVVWPRDPADVDADAYNLDPIFDDTRLPYGSIWINMREKHVARESGFYEEPRKVVKWDENTDSVFGFGRGLRALPDIRSLNEAVRLEFEAWSKSIDPTTLETENNVLGDVQRKAGGRIVVRDMDGFKVLHEGTKWDVTMAKRDELRQSIQAIYFTDLIREPGEQTGSMTAYEVAKRLERTERIIGEPTGRIRSNLLDWVIQRTFSILYRNGSLAEMPETLIDVDNQFDIQYTSQLAVSQQSQAVEAMLMYVGDMQQLAALQDAENPSNAEVLDHIDWDGIAEEFAARRNVPATIRMDEKQVKARREDRKAEARAAQGLAAAEQASKVVSNIGQGAGPEAAQEALGGPEGVVPLAGGQ